MHFSSDDVLLVEGLILFREFFKDLGVNYKLAFVIKGVYELFLKMLGFQFKGVLQLEDLLELAALLYLQLLSFENRLEIQFASHHLLTDSFFEAQIIIDILGT